MTSQAEKATAKSVVAELVDRFRQNEADYLDVVYNETQARTEFISPLLEAFGWDVSNIQKSPLRLREVIEEATVEVGEEKFSKRPDYELRLARQRKIFVEAKKPSVSIDHDQRSAFQVRRYGFSGSLPISILTNFRHLAVYDCGPAPSESDEAHVARLCLLSYDQFVDHFDDLWEMFAREVVYSGDFDRKFAVGATRRGSEQFDDLFLRQVRGWRERLAFDIHANCPDLTSAELTYAVQLFLCRIVFLRICEDRDIENYKTLKNLDSGDTFNALMLELRRADEFYDSGIFRLLDDDPLGLNISDQVLQSIIEELYYPQSPYTFSVVETEVLSQIYEHFLGEAIDLSGGRLQVVPKPEVREGGGVVATPQYVADAIIERALIPALAEKEPHQLKEFSVADICCGSGTLLLAAYEALLEHYLSSYINDEGIGYIGAPVYEGVSHQWRLTFGEKRRILVDHIRGIDIDYNAVEVTRFSLLLKLIEDETAESLQDYVSARGESALPALEDRILYGNSLVSYEEWAAALGHMTIDIFPNVNPLTWAVEFPDEMGRGGFDVIVCNPPYVRIQNMTAYAPDEVAFYQHSESPYLTGHQDNFDKYALFLERAFSLLRDSGRFGAIVPHKFMTIRSGKALRCLMSKEHILESIVHFGAKQVFGPGTANYTSILIFDRRGREQVVLEQVGSLEEWRYGQPGRTNQISADELTGEPWQLVDEVTRMLFSRIREAFPKRLGDLAEIFTGVQTSANRVYIFPSVAEDAESVTLNWNGRGWRIERDILRSCLNKVTLNPYSRPYANAWMIYPYELVPDKGGQRAKLIQPDEMAERFPVCWEYLNTRRAELAQRKPEGGRADEQQWYQFGRSQNLTKFEGPKIIVRTMSLDARYSYDDRNTVVTGGGNGPYYLIRPKADARISNFYLLAVLHHPLSEAMVRTITSLFQGGYYSHGKQFIGGIPVPVAPESEMKVVEEVVAELIDTLDSARAARTPEQCIITDRRAGDLQRRIEAHITTLFGLSSEDMEVINAVPTPY